MFSILYLSFFFLILSILLCTASTPTAFAFDWIVDSQLIGVLYGYLDWPYMLLLFSPLIYRLLVLADHSVFMVCIPDLSLSMERFIHHGGRFPPPAWRFYPALLYYGICDVNTKRNWKLCTLRTTGQLWFNVGNETRAEEEQWQYRARE
jgi:hypothetical protein